MADEPTSIRLDELKLQIRAGEIGPDALIRDSIFTKNEWLTLDNHEIFHAHAPETHPPGEQLAKVRADAAAEYEAARPAAAVFDAFMSGTLAENLLGIAPLAALRLQERATFASRLWLLPAFAPESVVTIAAGPEDLYVEYGTFDRQLWSYIGAWGGRGEPRSPEPKPSLRTKRIRYEDAQGALRDPIPFKRALVDASVDVSTMCLDGISYRHVLQTTSERRVAQWSNPYGDRHRAQCDITRVYYDLIEVLRTR